MLASTDETAVELGLKVLQGMNVTESPATVTCLLYGNYGNIAKIRQWEQLEYLKFLTL